VVVDDRQHVYITGIESNGQNIFTERTHRQEGNIWYRTHDAGGVDKGHALFVDQQGVVYVTGESLNGTSGSIVSLVYAQPRLQTLVLPEGTAGTLYAFPVPVAGGLAPYTWTLSSSNGSLPNGFSINSATGELGGMPDEGGTFSFTVKVTGQQGLADLVRYQLKIAGSPARPLTVTVDSLPTPTYTWYDRILTGAGGTLPYTWSIGSGSLPPGLNFYPDGRLQGYVPNGMTGYFSFAVRITDGDGLTVDKPFVFAILPLYPGYYCRLQHDPTALYGTIAAALQAIPDAGTLQMKTALLSGDMDCTRPVAITVRGGYADDYGAQTGMTTVMGTLTVTAGSVTVENLVLM
jgi:hypothetical protein